MGSEGSSSALDSSVNSNVTNNALFNVQTFSLSISMSILEEGKNVSGWLLWPSTKSNSMNSSLGSSSTMANMSSEGNALLVFENIFHVSNSLLDLHSFHDSSSLISILEMHSDIVSSALSS